MTRTNEGEGRSNLTSKNHSKWGQGHRFYLLAGCLCTLHWGVVPAANSNPSLDPIPLGESDREVRRLLGMGNFAAAASALIPVRPEHFLVRAYLALETNDGIGATFALEQAMNLPEPLRPFRSHLLGKAALLIGDAEKSLAAAEEVIDHPVYGTMAEKIKARALREMGRLKEARSLYEGLLATESADNIASALLGLARLSDTEGAPAKALGFLKRLDVEHPIHWTSPAARKLRVKIESAHPGLGRRFQSRTHIEVVEKAERVLKAHRNKEAVSILSPLKSAKLSGELACRFNYTYGRALRKLRRWKPARTHLIDAVANCEKAGSKLLPWALYLSGQAAERLGEEQRSASLFRRIYREFPSHRLADDGAYFEVRHAVEDLRDLGLAEKLALRALDAYPTGDMLMPGVFFVGLHALLEGDIQRAKRVLKAGLKTKPKGYKARARTAYWLARIAQLEGDKRKAIDGYSKLMTELPLTWYALLANSRLQRMSPRRAAETRTQVMTANEGGIFQPFDIVGQGDGLLKEAILLARLGLAKPAQKVLKANADNDPASRWRSAQILDAAGAYTFSHKSLKGSLPQFREQPMAGPTLAAWQIAYPRPYKDLVAENGRINGLPEAFIWGVMREESGFNPVAESFANAFGLMQLILPTARDTARKDEGVINRKSLSSPALNIKLGSRYLSSIGRASGAPSAVWPAAYNAGPGALRRWLKKRGHLELDLFVDAIPYEEARGYTKRVTSSRAIYQRLYSGGAPEASWLELPVGMSVRKAGQRAKGQP